MKKKQTIDETRRRFMAYFTSIGLGATLVPGVLWARMQDAAAPKITLDMLTDSLKLSGVEFTEEERQKMVAGANSNLAKMEQIRALHIPNDVSPPFHFSSIVPGLQVDRSKHPFELSKPPVVNVPGNIEDVAFWPIRSLSELLRTKQVSSVELTKMYLERLHRYNAKLNNTVTFLDDLAMTEAKQADADLAAGRIKSVIHGIPWGAKDIISVKGFRTTWGSGSMKEQVFDYDASVVEMVREAGGVLIAKLTSGEFAQGANWWGGQTKNPWNGGSSSGSSAGPGSATSAGCVGFSIGTETSGSILGPSATCGITGLRPTFGRVSRYGVMALGWTADRLGPMCRYAEDCAMVMSVIAKPDGRDMSVSDIPFNWKPALYDIKKLRVGILNFDTNANPNNQKVLDTLKSLGVAKFIPLTIPTDHPFVDAFNYEQGAFFDEFVRAGRVKDMTNPGRADGFKSARLMNVVDYLQGQRARMIMMTELAKATSGVDVYLVAGAAGGGAGGRGGPGVPGAPGAAAGAAAGAPAAVGGRGARGAAAPGAAVAGGRGGGGGGAPSAPKHSSMANAACYPAVNVPIAFSEKTDTAPMGSPINMVFFAPPFKETELLFVAKSYQDVAQVHLTKPVLTV